MDARRQNEAVMIRRGISWTPDDEQLANWIAERTDGGNVSRLLRRLLRHEAVRYDDAPSRERAREAMAS